MKNPISQGGFHGRNFPQLHWWRMARGEERQDLREHQSGQHGRNGRTLSEFESGGRAGGVRRCRQGSARMGGDARAPTWELPFQGGGASGSPPGQALRGYDARRRKNVSRSQGGGEARHQYLSLLRRRGRPPPPEDPRRRPPEWGGGPGGCRRGGSPRPWRRGLRRRVRGTP